MQKPNQNQMQKPTTHTGCPDDVDFPGILMRTRKFDGTEMHFHLKVGEYIPEDMISNLMQRIG